MKTIAKLAAIAAVLTMPVTVSAGSADPMKLKRGTDAQQIEMTAKKKAITAKLKLKMRCAVAGSPVEFPNDIYVANASRFAMRAGKTVHWQITGTSIKGSAVLPALAPGKGVYLSNAIPGGLTAGTPCVATAL